MDSSVGNYPQYGFVCHYNPAYGCTEVASKLELPSLRMSLCKGNDMV